MCSMLIATLGSDTLGALGALPLDESGALDTHTHFYNSAKALRLVDKTIGVKNLPLQMTDTTSAHHQFIVHALERWARERAVLDEEGLAVLRGVTPDQALAVFGRKTCEKWGGGHRVARARAADGGTFAGAGFRADVAQELGLGAVAAAMEAFVWAATGAAQDEEDWEEDEMEEGDQEEMERGAAAAIWLVGGRMGPPTPHRDAC